MAFKSGASVKFQLNYTENEHMELRLAVQYLRISREDNGKSHLSKAIGLPGSLSA